MAENEIELLNRFRALEEERLRHKYKSDEVAFGRMTIAPHTILTKEEMLTSQNDFYEEKRQRGARERRVAGIRAEQNEICDKLRVMLSDRLKDRPEIIGDFVVSMPYCDLSIWWEGLSDTVVCESPGLITGKLSSDILPSSLSTSRWDGNGNIRKMGADDDAR
jgi:hypothetical protein